MSRAGAGLNTLKPALSVDVAGDKSLGRERFFIIPRVGSSQSWLTRSLQPWETPPGEASGLTAVPSSSILALVHTRVCR